MIVILKKTAERQQVELFENWLRSMGLELHKSVGENHTIIGLVGDTSRVDMESILALDIVETVKRIQEPYKNANRKFHPEDTVIQVGNTQIGGGNLTIMAGPCSVESEEQVVAIAKAVKASGATMLRGGAFKPRTNPHSFQGLGEEALKIMKAAGDTYGLKTLTEVMDSAHCQLVADYVDGLQVGARNFQNFSLLKKIGQVTAESQQMVLYKRGFAGTIAEWLAATDYITDCGNNNVVLCERGIRTFETATRFTLDIAAVPVIHKQSLYPVCIDVSHPAGQRDLVPALAKAAVAAGADSLMIEVHPNPPVALSDGPQQLTPAQFRELVTELRELAACLGKRIV